MKAWLKRYPLPKTAVVLALAALIFFPAAGTEAILFSGKNLLSFLLRLPPIFLLTGLLDVWVDRGRMMNLMGENSGAKGVFLSLTLGMLTAVPFYALLPAAALLLKKGGKILNVLIFLCASAALRVPLLLFEAASLGWRFTLVRFALSLLAVLAVSRLIDLLLSEEEKRTIRRLADSE